MYRHRVIYADTDMAGVVYHGNYLRWFEAARTAVLYEAGLDLGKLHTEEGIVFAISECALTFHRSARYGDVLEISVFPLKSGPARMTLGYEVRANGLPQLVVTGRTTFAALDAGTGKVLRLPPAMRQAIERAMGTARDNS